MSAATGPPRRGLATPGTPTRTLPPASASAVLRAERRGPQRTDGRARLSISLDEAVAPCSFQCAAHSSRLFH
jgi:hypothetical protein